MWSGSWQALFADWHKTNSEQDPYKKPQMPMSGAPIIIRQPHAPFVEPCRMERKSNL
jgi:hypothetical protein